MNDSLLGRFFGVVARPRTWLNVLFNWLAFPLGLFYFVFLATGLSLGIGLIVIWVGIPILLIVAGAWWLFGAFERVQAKYLLGADVPGAPREWEKVEGVWGKLKAHFGSASTWKDLVYLFAKLVFGTVSTTLLFTAVFTVGWFLAMPVFALVRVPVVNGSWVPPLWFATVVFLLGILVFFVSLHVINAWSWVCARWAEVMFAGPRVAAPAPGVVGASPPPPQPLAPPRPPAPRPPVPPQPPAPQPAAPQAAPADAGSAHVAGAAPGMNGPSSRADGSRR